MKTFKIENSILIFSEARGGSTWLMELLKHIPGVIINWEPLQVDKGIVPKSYKFGWRPKIPRDNKELKYKRLFSNMMTMRSFNNWTTKYVKWKDIYSSKHVLTKFVRANQCLPWIVNTFPNLKHQPILLFRHPITTCMSRLKTFEGISHTKTAVLDHTVNFEVPDCINNERFIAHETYIRSLMTSLEVEVAIWCVNNANIITHHDNDKWYTLCYEDLVVEPKETLKKVLRALRIELSDTRLNQIQYDKASASNFLGNFKSSKTKQLESFLNDLSHEDLTRIQAIFDYFEFKLYSAFSAYPIK